MDDETTGCTFFTYQVPVQYIYYMWFKYGWRNFTDTPVDLEQMNKFNSTNQNMCSDAAKYPGVFSD